MGCASSAALPFLTNKGNQSVAGSPRANGELRMVNNKLKENGISNVKDINESYVSEKMKEVVDSTAVQGAIGGIVQAKDDALNQIQAERIPECVNPEPKFTVEDGGWAPVWPCFGSKPLTGIGETISEKVTSAVDSVEDKIESSFGKLTKAVGSFEDKVKTEVESVGGDVNLVLEQTTNEANAIKDSMKKDIDELLDSLPTDEDVKTAAEEVVEKAVEEVKEEVDN